MGTSTAALPVSSASGSLSRLFGHMPLSLKSWGENASAKECELFAVLYVFAKSFWDDFEYVLFDI